MTTISQQCDVLKNPNQSDGQVEDVVIKRERLTGQEGFLFISRPLESDVWEMHSDQLKKIVLAMLQGLASSEGETIVNGAIPAGYTYFGQFVAHEIVPSTSDIKNPLFIARKDYSSPLRLDSIYPDQNRVEEYFCKNVDCESESTDGLGTVLTPDGDFRLRRISTCLRSYDLPRIMNGEHSGLPLIPEIRNSENKLVSQMHVSWLRIHNYFAELVRDHGADRPLHVFNFAKRCTVLLFQSVVVYDFLPRVLDPDVYKIYFETVGFDHGCKFDGHARHLEFDQAAFRFGHTMVRKSYVWRDLVGPKKEFTELMSSVEPLEQEDVVLWDRFFDGVQGQDSKPLNFASVLDFMYPRHRVISDLISRLSKYSAKVKLPFKWNRNMRYRASERHNSVSSTAEALESTFQDGLKNIVELDIRTSSRLPTIKEIISSEKFDSIDSGLRNSIMSYVGEVSFMDTVLKGLQFQVNGRLVSTNCNEAFMNAPLILALIAEAKWISRGEPEERTTAMLGKIGSIILAETIKRNLSTTQETIFSYLKDASATDKAQEIKILDRCIDIVKREKLGGLFRELNIENQL